MQLNQLKSNISAPPTLRYSNKYYNRIIFFVFTFFGWALAFGQSPIYVSQAASGSNNGSSWDDAYPSLMDGLANAAFGDEVWVSAGTYTPWDASGLSFELPSGVKLYGGFVGTESSLAERNWEANPTILSGKIDDQEYSKIVLLITNPDTITLVDGFTIQNAMDYDQIPCSETYPCHSGGVELQFNNPGAGFGFTLRNCVIRDNSTNQGAGMSVLGEGVSYNLLIENCTIEDNGANFGAGGIHVVGGGEKIIIRECSFISNNSLLGGSGGIFIYDAESDALSIHFSSCLFEDNYIDNGGGGGFGLAAFGELTELIIDSCDFLENNIGFPGSIESAGHGGALYLYLPNEEYAYPPVIRNSSFINNYAIFNGGAIKIYSNQARIENCSFIGNEAGRKGGGMSSNSVNDSLSFISLTHNTIVGNKSDEGGEAIHVWGGNYFITNSLFYGHGTGPEDYILNINDVQIFAESNFFDVANCDSVFVEEGVGGSTFDCSGTNVFNIDPQFLDEASADYRLDYCSPLIDAGNRTIVEQLGIDTDIAGVDRIINSAPDIGAYENKDVLVNLYTQDLSCSGEMDGLAQVAPTGGQPSWTIEWSTGSNNLIIEELEPGSYWVSITDANSCSRYWEFEIEEATPIEAQFEVTDAWSSSSMDGAIDLEQISGGNPPYTYNWDTGDTTSSLYNLSPGSYFLTITDISDCDTTLVFNVGTINGIRDFMGEEIRLYPNPGQDRLWIEALPPGTKWQLFDAMGKLQMQGEVNERRFSVQTAELPKGVYFCRFYHSTWSSGFFVNWVKV